MGLFIAIFGSWTVYSYCSFGNLLHSSLFISHELSIFRIIIVSINIPLGIHPIIQMASLFPLIFRPRFPVKMGNPPIESQVRWWFRSQCWTIILLSWLNMNPITPREIPQQKHILWICHLCNVPLNPKVCDSLYPKHGVYPYVVCLIRSN